MQTTTARLAKLAKPTFAALKRGVKAVKASFTAAPRQTLSDLLTSRSAKEATASKRSGWKTTGDTL